MADQEGLTTADLAHPEPTTSSEAPVLEADDRPDVDDGREDVEPNLDAAPLFPDDEASGFRNKWSDVQGEFVDRPRDAVEQADRLVADLMQRLAAQFSETRTTLEQQWDGQEDVSTEDLRVAMTRYRSFFERLLSA
jgi:hypothetical protein